MNHFINSTESKTRGNESNNFETQNSLSNQVELADPPSNGATAQKSHNGLVGRLLGHALAKLGDLPLKIILPSGEEVVLPNVEPIGTIKIFDRKTAWAIAVDPLYQFAEAYSNGKIEIAGELSECLTILYRLMNQRRNNSWSQRFWLSIRRPHATSLKSSKDNIHHHYDIGNDFYRLWLDERMLYTCAYFARPEFTLEQAQLAKMDHVCRKLKLRPGMKVIEAGCGWGGLALHMAKNYGVRVRAFNISREQVNWAVEKAKKSGLDRQVEFVKDDWRNIDGKCDAFVSVGMLEHVGLKNYELFGRTIKRCLNPNSLGLIHSIGQNSPKPLSPWIERRIFPGAYPPTLKQFMNIFEPFDFSVLDVENLGLHYAETLRHWLDRF